MGYEIEVIEVQPAILASVRQRVSRTSLSESVPRLLGEVWDFIEIAALRKAGHNVALYRDPGSHDIEVECGVQVMEAFEGNDRVRPSSTPGGKALHVVHVGLYANLSQAWQALQGYGRAHGYSEALSWEVYGDWNDDPSKLRTDVYSLVREKA